MQKTLEASKKLYHYTNWDGLYGILIKDKSLWATHCRYLNDSSEILSFKPKLIEFLRPCFLKELGKMRKEFPAVERIINDNEELDAFARHYVDAMYDAPDYEFYITSFSAEHADEYTNNNGLLSQWRGYGKDGGFAIVFDKQSLDKRLHLEADRFSTYSILANVIYSDDEERFKTELSPQLYKIAEYILEGFRLIKEGKARSENPPPAFIERAQREAFPAFFKCVSSYKDRGFKEENEIRIVVWPQMQSDPQIKKNKEQKFRKKNGEYVPYIELFKDKDIVLSIKEIIVGPHKDKKDRAQALRIMLRNLDIDVPVSVSDIPYIG